MMMEVLYQIQRTVIWSQGYTLEETMGGVETLCTATKGISRLS